MSDRPPDPDAPTPAPAGRPKRARVMSTRAKEAASAREDGTIKKARAPSSAKRQPRRGTKRAAPGKPEGAPPRKCAAVAAKPSSKPDTVNDGTWSYKGRSGVAHVTPTAPTRTSDRRRTLTDRARGVGAATEEEVAAAACAREDGTVFTDGKFITKAERAAQRAIAKPRGKRPAAPPSLPHKSIKFVERAAGPSRGVSASTDGALAASSSTGGGYNFRSKRAVPVATDAANKEEIEAKLNMVCDDTVICNHVLMTKAERDALYGAPGPITPYHTLAQWTYFIANPVTKSRVSEEWFAKKGTLFTSIKTLAKAKFFLDFYLPIIVPRFAHSHELSLEEDTNIRMTWDDVFEVLAVLANYGRAERGLSLITGAQLKNLPHPLFSKEPGVGHQWVADNIQMAAMRFNPINIQTGPSGVPTPEDVARNNGLCAKKLVTEDTKWVARACMGAARAFEGVVDPKKRASWFLNNNDPGKPDTGDPTLDRLNAMAYAFAFSRIDCGLGTCKFYTRAKLDELGKSAQVCALETFCPSLLKSAVLAKRPNLSVAELDRLVTPERVASVIQFVPSRKHPGWHVDKTAAAWREMGIAPADVADRLKEVDTVAEDKGLKARV